MIRALAGLVLFGLATAAQAEERIVRFFSDVRIERDASLAVTETIAVNAENVRINRGIYRDFPTRYPGPRGSQMRVGFTFEGASLDGAPVPAKVESIGNGVRIKLGDPDRMVSPGEHVYAIRYRTTRQIGRFADYDELYWNVTGNGWAFPIDLAEARIRLPSPASFGKRAIYTGAQGSTASAGEVSDEAPGDIRFRTTAPLAPYEGLTVAVAFPKGLIAAPSAGSKAADALADYGPPLAGFAGLLGLIAFYTIAWQRAGRDPKPGTVVPLFSPPDDLSPAGMRYVQKMGADNRAFAAALVAMGVKGHVRLVSEDGGWFSSDKTRIERLAGGSPLAPDEDAALSKLVEPGDAILMEQKNHATFSAAQKALGETLKTKYEGTMFHRNWGWAFAGLGLFVAAIWLAAAAIVAATGLDVTHVLVPLGAIATVVLLGLWLQTATSTGKCLMSLVMLAFAALALATGLPVLAEAAATGWWFPLLLPALALPLMLSAFWWISAPTREGRAVLDRIAGFRQYLSITEGERLDRMHPPEADTPELFERYLPYAIALGVENRWADRFAGVLAAAAAQGQQGFAWYAGSNSPWDDPGGFADSLGDSLSSSISAASTAPGSSSGSGGGGSSGGGGGGGGGGGW